MLTSPTYEAALTALVIPCPANPAPFPAMPATVPHIVRVPSLPLWLVQSLNPYRGISYSRLDHPPPPAVVTPHKRAPFSALTRFPLQVAHERPPRACLRMKLRALFVVLALADRARASSGIARPGGTSTRTWIQRRQVRDTASMLSLSTLLRVANTRALAVFCRG